MSDQAPRPPWWRPLAQRRFDADARWKARCEQHEAWRAESHTRWQEKRQQSRDHDPLEWWRELADRTYDWDPPVVGDAVRPEWHDAVRRLFGDWEHQRDLDWIVIEIETLRKRVAELEQRETP